MTSAKRAFGFSWDDDLLSLRATLRDCPEMMLDRFCVAVARKASGHLLSTRTSVKNPRSYIDTLPTSITALWTFASERDAPAELPDLLCGRATLAPAERIIPDADPTHDGSIVAAERAALKEFQVALQCALENIRPLTFARTGFVISRDPPVIAWMK